MSLLSRDDLQTLLDVSDGLSVSLFLPTERRGAETQQNPIRYKNLLREAERQLGERDLAKSDLEELMAPLRRLVEDHEFWQHQGEGLAVFRAAGFFAEHRLPHRFPELCVVNERFYLKPLFNLLRGDGRFYVLGLSLHRVRLFEASRYSIHEIDLGPEVPQSLAEAVGEELEEQHLQYHTGNPGARGAGAPIYHGQGGGEDDQKKEIGRFFHRVAQALPGYLEDREAPLVLAAVDYLQPIYREASSHPHLLPEGVPGNPDNARAEDLHARAWELVEPIFAARCDQEAERFQELAGKGRGSSRLDEVLPAAFDGRVETLFVARGDRRWGRFDPTARRVQLHDGQQTGSDDLLDLAAVRTFLAGGTVYSLEAERFPVTGQPVAAIYRY